MDIHQVNSRALYDGPEVEDEIQPEGRSGTEDDVHDDKESRLEQRTTRASAVSGEDSFPDGGARAWSVVVGSWFALFASMGLMNTIALFQAYVLSHQLRDYDEGTVGWIFSVYTFLAFFCGIYIGPVFDKYGPRWLVIAGSVITVGGVVFMSFCSEFWQFMLAFGILCGLGTSLLFTPSIAAVGHWFRERRGFATGMASTAGGVGGIVFPLMQTALFDRIGYGWTTRCVALINLCCCAVGILLVRSRLPPSKDATAHPDFRIFRQPTFTLTSVALFLLELALFIPLTFISTYAVRQGFGDDFAYHLLPILNAGSALGRGLPGYYADAVGPFNTCIGSVVLSVVSCLCVWMPSGHTKAGIIVFAALFGFASGTSIAVAPVCIGRLCRTQEYGRYYATTYTVVSVATLIGVPIAGNIVKASGGSYNGLIAFTGAVYIASFFFLILAKVSALGWGGWRAAY